MRIPDTLAIVLAGGAGSRLGALTEHRAKPALPVAGTYRLIDISLSNLAHSHITNVWLAEQYRPWALNDHLSAGRPWDLDRNHGGLQVIAPFEGGNGAGFARGNSDTLQRQRDRIAASKADLVLVLSADHLYTMNFLDMVGTHNDLGADLTILTTEVAEDPSRYGVVQVAEDRRVTRFDYKPDAPEGKVVATEVFLYSADALVDALDALTAEHGRLGDYGEDLVPWFVQHRTTVEHRHTGYWMDVGTLQSYWTAHLQLLDGDGATLDDPNWPIYSAQPQALPARIGSAARITESLISPGAVVDGTVHHSVIGPGAVIEAGAVVRDSVVLNGAHLVPGVELTNCVVDLDARVDRAGARGSERGITLIGADGLVAERIDFDPAATLPTGFGR